MADVNFTMVTKFILLGLTDHAKIKVFLFLSLLIYTISMVGSLGMLFLFQIILKYSYITSWDAYHSFMPAIIILCTQNAAELLCRRGDNLFFCKHCTIFFYICVALYLGGLTAGSNGLWPPYGHHECFTLCSSYDKNSLCCSGHWLPFGRSRLVISGGLLTCLFLYVGRKEYICTDIRIQTYTNRYENLKLINK